MISRRQKAEGRRQKVKNTSCLVSGGRHFTFNYVHLLIPSALHNWHRFLKPGGLVGFSCYDETSFMVPVITRACAKACGVSLPNIHEQLGTPEKCHKLLRQAGFQTIEVKIEQFGEYLSLSDAQKWWSGGWLHPQGNPLLQLKPEQLEQCKAEYVAQVEALETDKGIWQDITTFFVLAWK